MKNLLLSITVSLLFAPATLGANLATTNTVNFTDSNPENLLIAGFLEDLGKVVEEIDNINNGGSSPNEELKQGTNGFSESNTGTNGLNNLNNQGLPQNNFSNPEESNSFNPETTQPANNNNNQEDYFPW